MHQVMELVHWQTQAGNLSAGILHAPNAATGLQLSADLIIVEPLGDLFCNGGRDQKFV